MIDDYAGTQNGLSIEPEATDSDDVRTSFDVFVSYRVRPDEELAGELKLLLESAIEPRPRVFVSGIGGLRASADSYREQLRRAAMTTTTYVGLITKASIDREWIFFEAGAAFGRGVLYAPVLVDVGASELPHSIGGYQGVSAADQERMREMIEDVAKAIHGRVKTHFAQRYSRFSKAVEAYGKAAPDEDLAGVPLAIHLAQLGRREEAQKLFDELIEAAGDPEKKADIRITKIWFSLRKDQEILDALEAQPADAKETAIFKLWMGVHESNPIRAVSLLREALDGRLEGFPKRWALTALSRHEFELGHVAQANARLIGSLASEDRKLRGEAAQQLVGQLRSDDALGKLLLLVEATIDPSVEHLLEAAKYCWEKRYVPLALQFGQRCVDQKDAGDTRLYRGLARDSADLPSLAFQDYRAAATHGESVAKSNMAAMLNSHAVPEAGLEILREHAGEFNAADPGLPYAVRAELERAVRKERDAENALVAYGSQVVNAIHRLIEAWRKSRGADRRLEGTWRAQSASAAAGWLLNIRQGHVEVLRGDSALRVETVEPFDGFYAAFDGTSVQILLLAKGEVEAVTVDSLTAAGSLEWLQFKPSEAPEPPEALPS